MRFVSVQDIDAAVNVVRSVCGFRFVFGLLFHHLDQAVNTFGEHFGLCLLFKHLKPYDIFCFESLNWFESGFVEFVNICPGQK
jgi:hypothetical protein